MVTHNHFTDARTSTLLLDAASVVEKHAAVGSDVHTRDGNIRLPVRERRVAQVEQDPVERLPLAAIDGERPCVHERQLRTTDHSGEPRLSGKEKHARPMVWYVGGWASDVSDLVVRRAMQPSPPAFLQPAAPAGAGMGAMRCRELAQLVSELRPRASSTLMRSPGAVRVREAAPASMPAVKILAFWCLRRSDACKKELPNSKDSRPLQKELRIRNTLGFVCVFSTAGFLPPDTKPLFYVLC